MDVQLLGGISAAATNRGTDELPLGGPTQRRLFAVLALHHGTVVPVDRLIDATWTDDAARPDRAERNIHTYLHRLRASLDRLGDRIETVGAGYRLRLEPGELDIDRFERDAATAERLAEMGSTGEALDAVASALAAWGTPLGEFRDEPWAVAAATRLHEAHTDLIELQADLLLSSGDPNGAISVLGPVVREHTYRERPRALLMQALYHAGRQAEALRAFQDYRDLLADEVGLSPSNELVDLDRQIAASALTEPTPTGRRMVATYEIGERIGVGAFAVVHRATQVTLGREVAIKIIRAELANRPEFVRRFAAEAQMVARIEHPHVVPLYDYWREPDGAYLVMRLMAGGTLEQRLDAGRLDLDTVARIVTEIASAIDAAHTAGVVHRDVKPENIMFDEHGRSYLSDFGIALETDELATPEAALSEGSPLYASPEQLRRQPVGPEADVYALGIVAWTMLVGRPPFAEAADEAALLERQLHQPIPPVSTERAEVPEAVDRVLATATAKEPGARYPSAPALATAFAQALTSTTPSRVPAELRRNPYKGLAAFDEADAAAFFGRERLVDELVATLGRPDAGLVVVVGPSGSGKSSVVRAGLVPALRRGAVHGSNRWFFSGMIPGRHPFEALETALLRVAVNPPGSLLEQLRFESRGVLRSVRRVLPSDDATLLLVIDQFEEVFAPEVDPVERDAFLDAIVTATTEPGSPLRVVATVRADFYDRPLRHQKFAAAMKPHAVTVTPLAPDELEHAITAPAARAGARFGDGVVARIVADVSGQPGALPMLQYALTVMYDRASGDVITEADYDAVGGIAGALARRAEELYTDAGPDEQRTIRSIFTRMVNVDDGTSTRRRVRRSELGDDPAIEPALDRFTRARLLTVDADPATREPTYEVAHEALIREWPRYVEWVEGQREDLLLGRRLELAARDWADHGRDDSFLLREGRLEQYRDWTARTDLVLTPVELEYLDASERFDETLDQRRREQERRDESLRRRSRLLVGTALAVVVMIVLATVALVSRNRAESSRSDAEAARDQAEAAQGEAETARAEAEAAQSAAEASRLEAETARTEAEVLRDEIAGRERASELAAAANDVLDDDPALATALALAAVRSTASTGEVEPDAVDALHFALQSSAVTFPADETTPIAVRPGPDKARGVFLLPVDELIGLAEEVARELTDEECATYFGEACPDLHPPLESAPAIAGGVDAYRDAYTDPEAPLTGTSITLAGWELQDTAVNMLVAVEESLAGTGVRVDYEQVDVRTTERVGPQVDLVYAMEPAWIDQAASAGDLVDMSGFRPRDEVEQMFGAAMSPIDRRRGGSVYAIPIFGTLGSMVHFDAAAFEEYGYQEPTTWDGLIALSDQMVDDGVAPWCWAAGRYEGYTGQELKPGFTTFSDWVETLLLAEFGPDVHQRWATGELAFSSEPVRRALDRLERLIFTPGYTNTDGFSDPYSDQRIGRPIGEQIAWTPSPFAVLELAKVDCLMTISPTYGLFFDPGAELGIFPFPAIDQANAGYVMGGAYLTAITEDRPETRAVLAALTDDTYYDYYADAQSGLIPPRLDYEFETPENDRTPGFGLFPRDFELIDTFHESVAEDRFVWSASAQMPVEVGMSAWWDAAAEWLIDPSREDEILAELDALRAAAAS